jgi:hypothetical protein
MKLQQYNFTIKYRPGKSNANADTLSRLHDEPAECYMMAVSYNHPEDDLNIGMYYRCQQERPFLQNHVINNQIVL